MPSFGITGEGVSISKINFSILILLGFKKRPKAGLSLKGLKLDRTD